MDNYYVYVYLDPRKEGDSFEYEPFYVGKGKWDRDEFHKKNYEYNKQTNPHRYRKIKNIRNDGKEVVVKRVFENLGEEEAFKREEELIKDIGRSINDNGPLSNIASGGKGISGSNSINLSGDEIDKIIKEYKNPDISVNEICSRYNISNNTLTRIRELHGVDRVSRHPSNYVDLDTEKREYIIREYTENYITDRKLSEDLDISRTVIRRVLKEESVDFHSRKDYIEAGEIDPPNEGMEIEEEKKDKILSVYSETNNIMKACRSVDMEDHYDMIYNRFKKDRRGPTWVEML